MITISRTTRPGRRRRAVLSFIFVLAGAVSSEPVRSEPQHDLLFFLSLQGFDASSTNSPEMDNSGVHASGDILYSYNNERFRFLAEYIASNEESELERFKAGWQINDQSMLWVGRYHSAAKFWTTEYHHGQFMQTSIGRPGVEEWEDESGPMPSHITGLAFEHEYETRADFGISFQLSGGLGSIFAGRELRSFDLLDPRSGHDLSVNFRMAYRPEVLSTNQLGFALAWNEIPVLSASHPNLNNLNHVRQSTVSLFGDWRWSKFSLLTNWVYFSNELEYFDSDQSDDFIAGYLQTEYEVAEKWKLFARIESSFGEDNSHFLQLLPAYVAHRDLLGVRWDFVDSHALTLEVSDVSRQGDDFQHSSSKEVRIQWSAVLP
jgi:hypothetical protein